jgi:hypothetical protein
VEHGRERDELQHRGGQPQPRGDVDRQLADAVRVPTGVVVVQLGRPGQARELLELRLLELAGRAARR